MAACSGSPLELLRIAIISVKIYSVSTGIGTEGGSRGQLSVRRPIRWTSFSIQLSARLAVCCDKQYRTWRKVRLGGCWVPPQTGLASLFQPVPKIIG